MCSIQPHSNKWGHNPNPGDKSVLANIERIRLIRNEYGHNSERSISDTDFNIKYQNIKDIVQELEKYLGSSTKYQDEVKELETCPMDPTQCEKNIKELLDLHEKIKDISGDVKEMKNAVLPWNIKVIYGKDVVKWKEDDNFFVETHNFQAMLDKVRQQPLMMFVGVPGSGKTATARHIALLLQKKDGYEILPTKDIKDIETYCNPQNPQVFVIDDVLGVFGFNIEKFDKLDMYKDRLNEPTMPETKILMTCREVVFNHEALSGFFLSIEKHVVRLHSEENGLNDQDKHDLFAKYNLDKDLLTADTMSKISKSFPYLCKLFSRRKELRHYGIQFFISPVPFVLELLDNMKIRNKVHYASLVLLMTNQNVLSEKYFNTENTEYFDEMKSKVLKRCKVDPVTCSFYLIDALTEMVGTYTEQNQSGFKFIHDSMLEIVAYHFGRQSPELILQYMDSDYIANYIKPDKYKCRKRKREEDKLEQKITAKEDIDTVADEENEYDLCIKLQESHYNLLADRLFKDVQNGQLFHVFENETLKNPLVLQKFLDVMKSKPYSELFTVFLSNLKEQVKLPKTSKKHFFTSRCFNLLINSRWIDDIRYTCARAIDWVIFYGHNLILQFIIDQIIKNTNTVNDLFQSPFNIDFCTTVDSTDCIKRNESDINENSARRCDVSDDESWSDLCSESDLWTEEGSVEKCRLLNLSCYSGDLLTFQTLIQYYDEYFPCFLSWGLSELSDRDADDDDDDDWDWHISDPPIVVASKTGHLNILHELLNRGAHLHDDSLLCAPLIFACSSGHLNIVIELLKHGADVNFPSLYNTPLTAACSKGHFDIAIELLKHKANVNITVSDKLPLIIACSNGYLDIVLELLKYGADVNLAVSDNSPLIAACSNGHLDIVVELLKHGADVNITSPYHSPVIAACSNGHLGILRELLKKGADINITVDKETPLIAACSKGHLDILLELLKHGADVNITVSNNSPLTAACSISYILHEKNLLRRGPDITTTVLNDIYASCSTVHLSMIRELLKNRADVNINFKISRNSPLIAACLNTEINLASVQELLKHGADANLTVADRSPLIAACSVGRSDVVLELLKHGADVNMIVSGRSPLTDFPYSPLIAACLNESKSLDIISELLKHGADVNRIVSDRIPLIVACKQGQLDIVSELVKHGADVNMKSSCDSPLISACSKGHFDVINELLNYGADVNMIVSGRSPLTASCLFEDIEMKTTLPYRSATYDKTVHSSYTLDFCLRGRLEIIRKLIKHGADVNGKNCTDSPLITACSKGHLNIVGELLKHGADVNITVSNNLNTVDELIKQRVDGFRVSDNSPRLAPWSNRHYNIVNESLSHGADDYFRVSDNSPLLAACSKGHLNIVNELLNYGADVNMTVSDNSPLLAACSKGHLNVVNELLKHGADVDITVSDNSPLLAACYKGYLDIISLLLKHGADINMTISGYSPLTVSCLINYWVLRQNLSNNAAYANTISGDTLSCLSCSKVHLAIIRKLLKHGADVNAKDCEDSPLNASCSKGHLNIVRELLKHGADVNFIADYSSPLITACQKGHLDIVGQLIRHGANVNIKVSGTSPLIAACSEGRLDIVLKLLKHGADVQMRVSDNSPLLAARSRKHLDIVSELLKHGANY